jgi:hypothetical protein
MGKHSSDILVLANIKMSEYFSDAPFPGARPVMQLAVRETKKGLRAGFD